MIVFPADDDAIFGILSSRMHAVWALAAGGTLEDRPRYNSSMTFEKFPFPAGLPPAGATSPTPSSSPLTGGEQSSGSSPDKGRVGGVIAAAAQKLNELRENWLNPPEWTERIPEVVAGYPERIAAKAYGWNDCTPEMPDEEILRRLLALNLERAG